MSVHTTPRKFRTASFALVAGSLALLALAACQSEPGPGTISVDPSADDQTAELRLVVKDDSTCLALREDLKDGPVSDSVRAAFVAACVVEIPSGRPLPPRPLPHPALRCEWAAAQIDSGRSGLVPAYVRHCAAQCDSLATADTALFAARCVAPPRPVKPPHVRDSARDSARPPHDTARPALPPAARALCDSLTLALDSADTTAAGYHALAHRRAAVCRLPHPRPPAPVPPPHPGHKPDSARPAPPPAPAAVCARHAAQLALLEPGTPAHTALSAHVAKVCPAAPEPSDSTAAE
jgi:hypothetical protein